MPYIKMHRIVITQNSVGSDSAIAIKYVHFFSSKFRIIVFDRINYGSGKNIQVFYYCLGNTFFQLTLDRIRSPIHLTQST